MRRHADRPGDAGGFSDEWQQSGGAPLGAGARIPPGTRDAGAQGDAGQAFNYYYGDNPGYTEDPTGTLLGSPRDTDEEYSDEDVVYGDRKVGWNAGTDLGLLLLRWVLGGVFAAHGAQKLGLLAGPGTGPESFAQALDQMGFQQTDLLALITGGVELGAGALLVLGLFTPLAAAGVLGVMASAVVTKVPGPFFLAQDGFEFEVVLGAIALGLLFTGPGRAALDNGRAWVRRPMISGTVFLLIAAAAAASVLLLLR